MSLLTTPTSYFLHTHSFSQTRLSFRVSEYDPQEPLNVPIDYCPVCTLNCTCAKCTRRLEDVSAKLKAECTSQQCGVEDVVMDNLFDLCSLKLANDRSKLKASSGGGNSTKKKGSSKKVKIDENANELLGEGAAAGGGSKRGRPNDDEDDAYVPRPSTSRSTRSSPSSMADDASPDGRPKKKKKVEKVSAAPVHVLKVNPKAFPLEMYNGKDLDPSKPEDLNTIFTPDGCFPAGGDGSKTNEQKYQDFIPIVQESHFFQCAICGLDSGEERICCKKCPRSYHKKCFEDSCASGASSSGVDDPSSDGGGATQKKRSCQRCRDDQEIGPGEEIDSGAATMDKTAEYKKVEKAFEKYKGGASSYTFVSMMLGELLQIMGKLKAYDYGDIFGEPGERDVVYYSWPVRKCRLPTKPLCASQCTPGQ